MKVNIITLLLTLSYFGTIAQESISGLQFNARVYDAAKNSQTSRESQAAIILPFFDDFSNQKSVFPNPMHWSDNYVFINDDYGFNPPTIGVATFDMLNNNGELYPNAIPFPFLADSLTSVDIRLDSIFTPNARKITTADSLYLSFFFQPQGYGNPPAPGDSLVLEFLAPEELQTNIIPADTIITGTDTLYIPADTIYIESWNRVWSTRGYDLNSFYSQDSSYFKQVLISISDSARYYHPDFRFRFMNYASLATAILPDWQSNGDQWNIDYVYLNTGRSINDTAHPDVAFAAKAPNMLRNYTSMPYDQYKQNYVNEMALDVDIKITNLDNVSYNASYRYEVAVEQNEPYHSYNGGNYFVPPFATSGYVTHPPFANPPVDFIYQLVNDQDVTYNVTHILNTEANLSRRQNDTIRMKQVFSNYMSYDDGTAEVGYGITPAGAQVAYRFQLNRADSLFGVNIFFNKTITQGNLQSFYLNVWNDNFGEPGDLIYSRFGYQPVFTDSLNKFFFYALDSALLISPPNFPNRIFYVGWEQATDRNINMGFDLNNDASSRTLFRTFEGWNTSVYKGALMMRPIIGRETPLSIEENLSYKQFMLYPNPATGNKVAIKTGLPSTDYDKYHLIVSTSTGKIIAEYNLNNELYINNLPNGFYIVSLKKQGIVVASEKLIINR